MEFWKLGAVYFCTVKTFFQFSKIRGGAGSGGQPKKKKKKKKKNIKSFSSLQ